ncbi:MAG: ImmA/IrrE family metallo-endopeptidase [Sphingobacteriales bacterium]
MSRAISNVKFRHISDLTSELVGKMNINKPRIPIEKIAKDLGVAIVETDLGSEISGMLVINGNDAVIALNPMQSAERKRFTIAHELGHFILHKESNSNVFVDRDFIVKYRSNKPYSELEIRQEQEANAFAASILMPQELIMTELAKTEAQSESEVINTLATSFDVSVPAMTYRLVNLNVLF